jgi:curved DNA-binding protein CbpA
VASGRDHYAILGITRSATDAEIRKAFRRLARESHPDVNREDGQAEARFKKITRAYATLSDPARRRRYDVRSSDSLGGGRFGPATFEVLGTTYHSDLGRDSDFYGPGDPLTVVEAADAIDRNRDWVRRTIRQGRLPAQRGRSGYLIRRRDAERLDRTTPRRHTRTDESEHPAQQAPEPAEGLAPPDAERAGSESADADLPTR